MVDDDYTNIIHKSLTGQITLEESVLLQQWLHQCPENKAEYEEIKRLWELPVEDDSFDENVHPDVKLLSKLEDNLSVLLAKERQVKYLRRLVCVAFGVSVVMIASLTYIYSLVALKEEGIYTILSGKESTIWLSDSSRVNLNSHSLLTSCFNKRERIVVLQGEALFSVKKDERPFVLRSDVGVVRVKGTSFYARAFPNQPLEVSVINGIVEVSFKNRTWHLRDGQYLSLKDGLKSQVIRADKFQVWTTNRLEFKRTPLQEVIRQVEKVYSIHCSLPVSLQDCSFTGTFDRIPLTDVIKILSYSLDIEFRQSGKKIYTITGKGCTP
jgi:transmembrane sensor